MTTNQNAVANVMIPDAQQVKEVKEYLKQQDIEVIYAFSGGLMIRAIGENFEKTFGSCEPHNITMPEELQGLVSQVILTIAPGENRRVVHLRSPHIVRRPSQPLKRRQNSDDAGSNNCLRGTR